MREIKDAQVPDYKKTKEQLNREKLIKSILKAQKKMAVIYNKNPRLMNTSQMYQAFSAALEQRKQSAVMESEGEDIRQLFMQKEA